MAFTPAVLADWPQWRGPHRDGVSTDTTPIAETFPAEGLKQVWESEHIPSDHYGGHGSPVVAGERVFLSVVWHERVPSETRVIDTEVMQQLNYRGTSEELAKKLEDARLNMPRLRGEKMEQWIADWRKQNLTEKEEVSIGSWVASRFKAGATAIGLEWLKKISDKQEKPFANSEAFKKWLDDEGFPPAVKEKMLQIVPNTVKVAKDAVICLDLTTGKKVWKFEAEGEPVGRKASSTAAVVDGKVYSIGSKHLYCVSEADGKLIWKAALASSGPAASPLIAGDRVYVAAGRALAFLTADGKQLWEQKEARGDTASPVLWKTGDGMETLVIHGNNNLLGLDPADGKVLWTAEGGGQSTPVTSGDWLVIYSGTKDVGLRAYRHQAGAAPKAAWSHFWVTLRYSGSPVIYDGHVYLMCGGQHQCFALETGELKWRQEQNSTITSPVLADGKLLVMENNGSHFSVIKAAPTSYQALAKAKVGAMGCTSPALSDGRLVLRQKEKIVCYDVRDGAR
jgi:outer membrane protein assembly factor BamB